ncbi:MAG: lipopolysaccharide transport periplasmic protein LptA [Betaproteobacteria bacterium]|nr:lipopolysaccharide transport periplasmic protein LptA [Betaproteobacteria bacterium]
MTPAHTRSGRPNALRAAALALILLPAAALAEKADKDKPTQIEANRMSSDDARRMSIFEGNVVLTKGTIRIVADRIIVRQDVDGFQISTATGAPAKFRQKREGKEEWIEGEGMRIEIDDKAEKVELRERAVLIRDKDEVRGDIIDVDTRSEFFTVTSGKSAVTSANPQGRVRAVIQPKNKPEDAVPGTSPAAAPAVPAAPSAPSAAPRK